MKNCIVFSLLLTLTSGILAQSVINRNHLMFPGDEFFVAGVSSIPSAGPGGANAVWNFSSVQPSFIATNAVENADETPYANDFPAANIAFFDQTSGSPFYQYGLITEDSWEEHGYVAPQYSLTTFENPRTFLQFPFTYNDQWEDEFSYVIEYQIDPPFTTFGEGVVDVRVDGYGTLMLPQSTFDDVLRVRIIAEATDTSAIGNGLNERNYIHDTTFVWFSPSYHGPLCTHVSSVTMRTTTLTIGDTIVIPETLEYHGFSFDPMAEPVSSVDDVTIGIHALHISPNPFDETIRVAFESDQSEEMLLSLRDLHGRILHHEVLAAVRGENSIQITLPVMPAGTFVAILRSSAGIDMQKLIRINSTR